MTFTLFLIACQPDIAQPQAPQFVDSSTISLGSKENLSPAEKVACIDLNQDKTDDIILFSKGTVNWGSQNFSLNAGIHVIERNSEHLLIASGFSREFREAPKQVHKLSSSGIEAIWTDTGERNQITDIAVVDNRIFLSEFTSGTTIQGGWLTDKVSPVYSANMAVQQRPLPEDPTTIIVGRLYGDTPRSDGDLNVVRNGKSSQIKNFRGVRSLELTDLNNDGMTDLLVSEGWHYQYASQGQARISVYFGPDYTDKRTLAILDDEYTINHIEKHRDHPWILAQGSTSTYLLTSSSLGWNVIKVTDVKETGQSTFCYDGNDSYILTSGNPATKVPIHSR